MVASSPFADSADCCAKASFESSSSIAGFSSLSNSSQQSHHFLGTNDNASKFSCSSSSTDATSRNSLERILPIHHGRDSMKILSKPHKVHDQAWDSIKRLICKEGTLGIGQFKLLRRVGQGDIGSVFLSQLKGSNCQFAMKVMDKDALTRRKKLQRIYREREILEVLDHPFLPTLYAHFEAEQFSCLVMDFCSGGDLHAVRQKHPGKRFGVKAARFYAAEVLLALEYLHMLGIVYRDLKPENVLVRGDGHIMLTDFDLSFKCDVQPKLLKCPMSASISSSSGRFGLLRSFSVSSSMSASSHWQDISMDCMLPSACTIHPFLSCLPLAAKFSTKAQETQKQNQKHPLSLFYFKQLGRIKSSKVDVVTSGLAAQAPCQVGRTEDAGRKDEKTCNFNTHEDSKQAAINLSVNGSAPSLVINGSTVPRAEDACIYEEMLGMELVAEPTQARSMSFVGTHEYLAPEVIAGQGHGNAVDWWTFGIFLFELLYGRTPFKGSCNEQTLLNIIKQPLRFPEWGHVNVGEHTKSLIEGLLVKDPQKRLGSIKGAAEIKQHSFFRGVNWALIRSTQPPEVPNNNKTKATLHHHHHHHNYLHNQQHRHQDDEQGKLLIASRSASKPLPHFDYF